MNDTVRNPYADPQRECDLVMKGGVTSGLVYPPAVLELATQYRIRNIGGTSAGAVAAALTAAAEYGRARGGYAALARVSAQLQEPGYLRNLFQGSSTTEPLLALVIDAPQHGERLKAVISKSGGKLSLMFDILRWLARALHAIPTSSRTQLAGVSGGVLVGALAAAAVFGVLSLFYQPTRVLFAVLFVIFGAVGAGLGAYGGALVGRVFGLYDLAFSKVPDNLFGICSGLRDASNARYDTGAVTEWLCDAIEKLAGPRENAARPFLSFGDLKNAAKPITLQFVTTDVSDARPYVLPFEEPFIFKRSEFLRLFPKDVVDQLVKQARNELNIRLPNQAGEPQYLFLPASDDWPIVVAARLSMSFPMFFSSAPLYRLPQVLNEAVTRRRNALRKDKAESPAPAYSLVSDQILVRGLDGAAAIERDGDDFVITEDQLVPHWLSDGGIASNFPIHFFDGWLPARPTFGITLRYTSAELLREDENHTAQKQRAQNAYVASLGDRAAVTDAVLAAGNNEGDVWLPKAEEIVAAEWRAIHHPGSPPEAAAAFKFLWGVVTTMQNYRDNMLAALASYRERIVQVRLGPDEGGFNLEMPRETIEGVIKKGQRAGSLLREVFDLEHHQWVRLRMLLSRTERAFLELDANASETAKRLIDKQLAENGYPFRELDLQWCEHLSRRSDAFLTLPSTSWQGPLEHFESESTLRVTPHP